MDDNTHKCMRSFNHTPSSYNASKFSQRPVVIKGAWGPSTEEKVWASLEVLLALRRTITHFQLVI